MKYKVHTVQPGIRGPFAWSHGRIIQSILRCIDKNETVQGFFMRRTILTGLGVLAAFGLGAWYGQGRLSDAALREQAQPIRILYPAADSAYNLKSVRALPYKLVYRDNVYTYNDVDGDKEVIVNYGNGIKVHAKITSVMGEE